MTTLAWVLALVSAAVAAGLYVRLRSMTVELGEAQISAEKLAGELQASRGQLQREAAKQRRKGEELADLRKRHDKLKKRADTAETDGPSSNNKTKAGSGGSALDGAAGERAIEQVRQERDRAREEARTLASEALAARSALARATPAEGSLPAAAAQALRDEAKQAQDALAQERDATRKAEEQVARFKKRLEAQELAYVALRGELEAKKDRLLTQAEQLERLRALKVVLVDATDEPVEPPDS